MSLAINLAVLAEGAATDSRGNVTLVSVNPQVLVADELPAQFSPLFVVIVEDDENEPPIIVPGNTVTTSVQATDPDGVVVFFTQLRQVINPPPNPNLRSRVQLIAQLPFTAAKAGLYTASADVVVVAEHEEVQGQVTARRKVRVSDMASIKLS